MKISLNIQVCLVCLALEAFGQGTMLWNESLNGPLSQTSANPTALPMLQAGTNTLIGTTEIEPVGSGWAAYHDFFTLEVPSDSTVSTIHLQVDTPNVWLWIGSVSFDHELAFITNPSSGELLLQWQINSIGPGVFGMYVGNANAQSAASIANYRLDFFVQAIPEPSTFSMWLVGQA